MKFSLTSATLLLVFKLTTEQQCRYVIEPDCSSSDDASVVQNGGFFGRSTKGEKGERGYSGKLGPKGIDGAGGPKGEMGQKGMKGDPSGSVEELIRRVNGKCFTGDWFCNSCQRSKETTKHNANLHHKSYHNNVQFQGTVSWSFIL